MGRFDSKVALVTGAGSGIGRTTAVAFAKEGAKVIVGDISENGGLNTVDLIKSEGGEAIFVKMDVSRPEDHEMVVEKAVELWGSLDYAFNNAGIEAPIAPIGEYDDAAWQRVMDINLTGVYYALKYQVPQMLKQGGGSIVNTASTSGIIGSPFHSAYVASKHAVIGLTKSVALENSKYGVRCNAVAPGVIETEMFERTVQGERRTRVVGAIPAGKLGQPEDVAKAVMYLCSDEASFVTGHTLVVDGAMTVQ